MQYLEHEIMTKSLKSVSLSYGKKIQKHSLSQQSTVLKQKAPRKLSQDDFERLEYDIDNGLLMGEDAFMYRGIVL